MTINLSGQVAIVTGASRGIGAATTHRLSLAGAAVVLTARSAAGIAHHAAKIVEQGGRASAIVADVSRYADVAAVVEHCLADHGRLDILVNNAGLIDPIARLAESDPDEWARVADINYKGVYHGLRAALPEMLTRGSGIVVNISSGAATSALEGWSHYCSSKAAVLSLTRCADKEYRDHGIRVVGLSPGTVATDMQVAIKASGINPVSQLDPSVHISAEWAAEAVAWLCTDAGAPYAGTDFSLKTEEGRRLVGLIDCD
jgi:3-oxoacyl-[acyl-carrier protein] reductase